MLTFPILLVLHQAPTSAKVFEQIIARHRALKSANVEVRSHLMSAPLKVTFSPVLGRISTPTGRLVEVSISKIRFYDSLLNQVAVEKNSYKQIGSALIACADVQREPLAVLIDPKNREAFMNDLKRSANWNLENGRLVQRSLDQSATSIVEFDGSYRLKRVKITVKKKLLSEYSYAYVDEPVRLIPASAMNRTGLIAPPSLPPGTSAETSALIKRSWKAMASLGTGSVTQLADRTKFFTKYRPGLISESGPKGSWKVDGSTLTFRSSTGKSGTRTGTMTELRRSLRDAGITASPLASYVMRKEIPFMSLYSGAAKITKVGRLKHEGVNCSLLLIKSPASEARIYLADVSARLHMVSFDAYASNGKVISSSRTTLTY